MQIKNEISLIFKALIFWNQKLEIKFRQVVFYIKLR